MRRHVVVGIALNNCLVPQLKGFVDHQIEIYYKILVKKYGIDSSQSRLDDKVIRRERLGLNIFDRGKLLNNIKSHNELAKHYQQQHMTTSFKSILDEATDASAIITMLERSCQFGKDINDMSKEIRVEIRNKWAHCNYKEWTEEKYLDSFHIMIQLVSHIFPGSSKLEDELREWQDYGIKLMGQKVDCELVQKMFEEILVMNETVARWEDLNKEKFDSLILKIEQNSLDIKEVTENIKIVEEEQTEMK